MKIKIAFKPDIEELLFERGVIVSCETIRTLVRQIRRGLHTWPARTLIYSLAPLVFYSRLWVCSANKAASWTVSDIH
ncbi:hypothetical protein [Paraburkholderia caledonica]|uniref:hypothetical protein n=1 Tax=Paraburkholderia caledonica TaxID=134536 RepID=UPI0011776420|nr:hypothetical protein [Paraburkholderia caledonica]